MTGRSSMRATLALCVVLGSSGGHGAAAPGPVVVPRGDGAPVVTDGMFTAGEWDDAATVVVNDGVTLHVKEYRGVVFIGVRGAQGNGIGPSDLMLAGSDGAIRQLHRSYALAEAIVPPEGPMPKLRLGFTSDWYANEMRRDEEERARLQKEGKDPLTIMRATDYPADGMEFAIRRSKIPGQVWRLRLWASAFSGGKPGMVTYPADAAERTTDGWLELRLQ